MSYKTILLLGSICAAGFVLSAGAAQANGIAGTASADYANYSFSGASGSADSWGGSVAGRIDTGLWDMKLQGNAAYHNISASGISVDNWGLSGNAYWEPGKGRLGLSLGYQNFDAGPSLNITNYGAFAEWWASDAFTLSAKGGGFSGNYGIDGYYLGGEAKGYVMPDVALSGSVDYTDFNSANETDLTAMAEWLVSEDVPVSISGGYRYSDISGFSGHVNTWFVALTWYCDEDGSDPTLAGRQRSGTLNWTAGFRPVAGML